MKWGWDGEGGTVPNSTVPPLESEPRSCVNREAGLGSHSSVPTLQFSSHSSVQFTAVQDGIYAPGKVHMRSAPSLKSVPKLCLSNGSSVRLPSFVL